MAKKKAADQDSAREPTFEESLEQLETIVRQLEDGELAMDQALGAYEKGIGYLKRCYHLLEAAEQKVQLLAGVDEAGNAITESFSDGSNTGE